MCFLPLFSLTRYCTLALILLVSLPALANKSVNYIYIESGEGNSSGGHAALQLHNSVFHYQYVDPGLIQLEKQSADDFEFNYRYASNRTLHLSQITISEQTYQLLADYFNLQHQLQQQQFSLRDDLNKDRLLLNTLLASENSPKADDALSIEGAGLFYTDADFIGAPNPDTPYKPANPESPTMAYLHRVLRQSYGDHFLARHHAETVRQIEQLTPPDWAVNNLTERQGLLPAARYSFANRFLDLTAAVLAIRAVEQHRPLIDGAFIMPPGSEFRLSIAEITTLKRYRGRIIAALVKLFISHRPDWGFAVLTNSARLAAIDQSIRLGRLVLIDTYETQSQLNSDISRPEYQTELRTHINDARKYFIGAKRTLTDQTPFTEQDYSWLEMQGNRYTELKKAANGTKAIRLYGANLVPTKSIRLPLLTVPALSKPQLEQALHRLDEFHTQYNAELRRLYTYNLLTRNCVTELFQSIGRAFLQQQQVVPGDKPNTAESKRLESMDRLGGYVDTAPLGFIPVTSLYAVQNQYRIADNRTLPSLRLMQLNRLYQTEPDILVYFRESNTLTSTIYKQNINDSFFIFFTDNQFLLRPLFGAVNTLSGIGQSLLGLLTLPFDSGAMLNAGTTGILMSLPELAFVNMRKGSFQYLPYSSIFTAAQTLRPTTE